MKQTFHFKSYGIIALTLLVAFVLTLMPLPAWALWFRPCWVAMVVMYWAMALPTRLSVGLAWCVGILLDVLQDTLLGQHALALTLITYVIVKMHVRLRFFPGYQQASIIFLLLILYQLLLYWPQRILHHAPPLGYWLASVMSFIIWPWLFQVLRAIRRGWQVV